MYIIIINVNMKVLFVCGLTEVGNKKLVCIKQINSMFSWKYLDGYFQSREKSEPLVL